MSKNIEPLTPALWFQRIAIIAEGQLGSLENSLRHAGHLIQLAPATYRQFLPPIVDEERFEALLDAGDLDSAARQLFSPATSLLIEADHDRAVRAAIDCPVLRRTIDGVGDTEGAAMLHAWARWLITLRMERGAEFGDRPGPVA